MMSKLNGDWEEALKGEFKKPYYKELYYFIKNYEIFFLSKNYFLKIFVYFN